VKDLKAALDNLDGGLLDARPRTGSCSSRSTTRPAALKTNGRTLDINTQKGRDNQAALDDIASSAARRPRKRPSTRAAPRDAAAIMANGRKHFIAVANRDGDG
jgi:hypothetical protein